MASWIVLVRYALGPGARPEVMQGNDYPDDRIVERLVPVEDTFLKDDVRYYRVTCGHGDWIDIPCSLSSSS